MKNTDKSGQAKYKPQQAGIEVDNRRRAGARVAETLRLQIRACGKHVGLLDTVQKGR